MATYKRILLDLQGGRCCWCGQIMLTRRKHCEHPMFATIEHIIQLCDGGTDAPPNLAVACKRCNNNRGHRRLVSIFSWVNEQQDNPPKPRQGRNACWV